MTYEELLGSGVDRKTAKLKSSIFFVEATSTEQYYLWKEYHERVTWVQDYEGFAETIGHINSRPVVVSYKFAEIFGKRICFYEATSTIVDHTMVEAFIKENYPIKYDNDSRTAMTDAMNFHNAIHEAQNFKD